MMADDVERDDTDWREEGPFDAEEVDLEGDMDGRVDLGTLIVTPEPDTQMQLRADQFSGAVQAIMVMHARSAMDIMLFAAPRSEDWTEEIRDEILEETERANGTCEVAEGPFGVELRRVLPTTDEQGRAAMNLSRTWLVGGPRWVLRAVLQGEVCVTQNSPSEKTFTEFFRNIVVNRGDEPRVAGAMIPMSLPEGAMAPSADG